MSQQPLLLAADPPAPPLVPPIGLVATRNRRAEAFRPAPPVAPPGPADGLSELTRFLSRSWRELDVRLDPNTRTLWCHMRPNGPPSFTPSILRELNALHRAMQVLAASQPPDEAPHILYYVQASRLPGIFNLGGDLGYISRLIRAGDRESVRRYAFDCCDAVFHAAVSFEYGIVSVGLLQGDALGGGFEAALSCNMLIAERSTKLGLPEILFNSFPGMGAYSFLSRRLDTARAERIIFSGKLYSADEMHAMGVVDMVVEDGEGEAAVAAWLTDRQSHSVRQTLYKVRQRVNPISLTELRDVTDLWVDAAMRLSPADLRRMEHLQLAQIRRLQRAGAPSSKAGNPS